MITTLDTPRYAELAEIEKFILLYLSYMKQSTASTIIRAIKLPKPSLKYALETLIQRQFLAQRDTMGMLSIVRPLNVENLRRSGSFKPVSFRSGISKQSIPEESMKILDMIDSLYQNSVDLYMLHYSRDALEKIKEVFWMLNKYFVQDWYSMLHEVDAEIILSIDEVIKNSTEDISQPAIDFMQTLACKIIQHFKNTCIQGGMQGNAKHVYEQHYLDQKEHVERMVIFLETIKKKNSLQVKQRTIGAPKIMSFFLLYFDRKIGPTFFYETGIKMDDEFKVHVQKIMDIMNHEPFFYTYNSIETYNYQFEIYSPIARGNREYLQFTAVVQKMDEEQRNALNGLFFQAENDIKENKDSYKLFSNRSGNNGMQGPGVIDVASLKVDFLANLSDICKNIVHANENSRN